MSIDEFIAEATAMLKEASIYNPRKEAYLFVRHFLECDELYIMSNGDKILPAPSEMLEAVQRRANNVPFEYITQRANFFDYTFYVDERVLIPRPETELLIENIALHVDMKKIKSVAEVGVGSGIISIVLALRYPHLHVKAYDISNEALEVAKMNVKRFNLQDRISLAHSDLLSALDERVDMVVSNPPYIAKDAKLEPNVLQEPHSALFGGVKGDELLLRLMDEVKERAISYLACEYGYDQRQSVEDYLKDDSVKSLHFYKDFSHFDRGFILERDV